MVQRSLLLAVLSLSLWGCADEFSDYNQVDKLRVLAMRAEPPELAFEDETVLDALVVGEVDRYAWSWCPFGYTDVFADECPITEEEFRQLVAAAGGQEDPPSFALGSEATQPFVNLVPPAMLELLCAQIGMVELPEGFEPPPCDGRFDVSVRLEVEGPEGIIITSRDLTLIYQEGLVPNQNPSIAGGQMSVRGAPPFPFVEGEDTVVAREVDYSIAVEVEDGSIELFEDPSAEEGETLERLTMTWFFEGGTMDKSRSSFIDGVTDLENLGSNVYTTPSEEEYEPATSQLFFVLRDDRGGIDWYIANLELSL